MVVRITGKGVLRLSKEISPALTVLFFSILFSYFFDSSTPINGREALLRALTRFIRFALPLCLPLYVLLPIYRFVVARMREKLLQTEKRRESCIHPFKHWIFRPLQGIGIGLLFEAKLLAALQILTGVTAQPVLFFSRGQSQLERLLVISGITVIISLLLSTLWTLDDVGIQGGQSKGSRAEDDREIYRHPDAHPLRVLRNLQPHGGLSSETGVYLPVSNRDDPLPSLCSLRRRALPVPQEQRRRFFWKNIAKKRRGLVERKTAPVSSIRKLANY